MALTTEIAWAVLLACQVVLLAVMLFDGLELTEVVWTDRAAPIYAGQDRSGSGCTQGLHPCAVLQRTAAHGDADAQRAGKARQSELRSADHRQQYAGRAMAAVVEAFCHQFWGSASASSICRSGRATKRGALNFGPRQHR